MAEFKDRLKQLRKRKGLTQEELSQEIGISRSTIGMYETGKREADYETLETFADFFNVDMNYLTGWSDDPHDWEKIGNEEGIYPPHDYEGSYEDYVKYKLMEESDNLIDNYYDLYDDALTYLKNLGCQITELIGTDNILIVTPRGEKLNVNTSDLIYNFMVFGASNPGIKKLIIPRRIVDLREDEYKILASYNSLNMNGRVEAQKRIDELTIIPLYSDKISILNTNEHSIPNAARPDEDGTDEERKISDSMMEDDSEWT